MSEEMKIYIFGGEVTIWLCSISLERHYKFMRLVSGEFCHGPRNVTDPEIEFVGHNAANTEMLIP